MASENQIHLVLPASSKEKAAPFPSVRAAGGELAKPMLS
jgi:hypothetical protein